MLLTMLERDPRPAAKRPLQSAEQGGAQDGPPLGRIGTLEVRLARDASEVAAAQEVRFRVFYDELGARRHVVHALEQRDADRFDAVCDHLIVLDTSIAGPDHQRVVATYRLLDQERAAAAGGFYSQAEFDLESLVARHPNRRFLELGRSCVLPGYRGKRAMELLWQGVWAYCLRHDIDVMAGCASFPGMVPAAHSEPLSFLAQACRAEPAWDVSALPDRHRPMDLMPAEAVDPKAALAAMPPLVKGYLRLGGRVGDGCVVDSDFGTTDVFIVLPVERISQRYLDYYGLGAERFSA
jgi:putative hemolysin